MAGELKLATHHDPSIFNKDMLLGGLLGGLMPVGLLAGAAALPVGAAVIAGGALLGGIIGKIGQQRENRHGKTVGQPSLWNKDTLIGGLIGIYGAGLAAAATLAVSIGGIAATAMIEASATPLVVGIGAAATLLALVATPVITGYIGGKIGERRQHQEYEQAKKEQILGHVSENMSPEVAHAVEYTMAHKKDWGTKMMEEKLLAAAQQPQK